MAERFADLLNVLTDKLLCAQCQEVRSSLKQLPCLHSVCLSCLRTLRQTRGQDDIVACRHCQQECTLGSGGADDLPESPYIASLHAVSKIMKSKLSLMACTHCNEPPLKENYCTKCEKFWCENCLTKHNATHVDHGKFVALKDIPNNQSPLKPCTYCKEEDHQEEKVQLFCTKCDIALCALCNATDHENHKKEVLKTAAVKRQSQMKTLIDEQLKEAQKKMDEVIQIDEEYQEVDRQETEVKEDVINFFNVITERLEAKKNKILEGVQNEAKGSRALLKRQKKIVQNQGEVIRFAMEATEAIQMHSTSAEIIDLKKSLDEIVHEVKEEERNHCDPNRKPLQMKFLKDEAVSDILEAKGIGVLQVQSETSANRSSFKGNRISEVCVGLSAAFTLSTRNAKGDPYYNKRDRITVEIKDKDGQDIVTGVSIKLNQGGTYQISYFAKEAGNHEASVKVNEEHVSGSPFRIQVRNREFKPEKIFGQIYGEGMERWGLAVSDDDQIAMTMSRRNAVQLFESDMITMLSFTKPDNKKKEFDSPHGIAFDKMGRILVADSENGVVHTFSRKLESREYEYKGKMFGEKAHRLKFPHGLSIDKDGGNIIVADTGNKLIKIFSPEGEFIRKIGQEGNEEGSFKYPVHCVQCDKYFIVSDTFAHAIKVFDREGAFLYQFGKKGAGMEDLNSPRCLAVDKVGQLLVCDSGNDRVQVFKPSESRLEFVETIGKKGKEEGEFQQPFSVGVLSDGRIAVNDVGNKRMQTIA